MEELEILKIIMGYIIPFFLGGTIGFISTKLKKNKKKDKAIEEGVQALLRNELIRRYREYEQKGELSILDKENVEAMFVQYENLSGKETEKQLMTEGLQLHTKIIR